MLQPAARVTDMHVCPMITPGVPPVPHVGGPLLPSGAPVVIIGGLPAATLGTIALCTGAIDTIIMGSSKVFIGNKPAARMGDICAHGGTIVTGCPVVLLG
ncbi:PAAR domain-containing protein [Escherichia coli :H19]|uniref:PAAR domain-containing protein n=1 Tax=Escherichia coli TaxID=562 RepID=UPI000E356759|nr:PAAR domain-containing protein [Escherichia coli]EGJ4979472.1 type VI secretion protein [Escherichia coli]EGJ6409944.1 type VI secretion protein [Escherichia coli]RFQ16883.1 type VI secretion protein [Escherichia coli]